MAKVSIFSAMNKLIPALVYIALFAIACGPAKYIEPLKKGHWAAHGHLGGPLFKNLGYPMPIPLTSVGAGYGLADRITVFSDFQLTEAAFGVLHLNVGGTYYYSEPTGLRPGLSSTLILNNAFSIWDRETKIWPQVDFTARWKHGKKDNIWYGGLNNFFELSNTRAHEEEQPRQWLPAVFAGHVFTGKKWDINVEGKLIAPFIANNDVVVEYIGAGNSGSFGFYFGIAKKF